MAEKSSIEWTDATWPIVQGCSIVSPGCKNCYAVNVVNRVAASPNVKVSGSIQGLVAKNSAGRLYWTGKVACREDRLDWPLKWKKGRMIFVPSHGDLFHEDVPNEFLASVFGVMAATPHHTYQVLTKRPERMLEVVSDYVFAEAVEQDARWAHKVTNDIQWPLPNVWLMVSVESQPWADVRIPLLLRTPAVVRGVSYEPALKPVDFSSFKYSGKTPERNGHEWEIDYNALIGGVKLTYDTGKVEYHWSPKIDWIIVGGESGPRARPCEGGIENAMRSTLEQCRAAGVAYFGKQMGSVWAKEHGGDPKGGDMSLWPEDLRVQEFPKVKVAV